VPPTADEQIGFLVKLQRLLDEGSFVASYKFALLATLLARVGTATTGTGSRKAVQEWEAL
jgi:hypothetical protein